MKPVEFREQTGTLSGGPGAKFGTGHRVDDLQVYRGCGEVISCWAPTWRERFALLFGARVWLRVLTPNTHAPVLVTTEHPFQENESGY